MDNMVTCGILPGTRSWRCYGDERSAEEIHRDIFIALWAWKLGQVGWKKTSQRVHEVNCTNCFYLASCWNTILAWIANPKESQGTESQCKSLLMCFSVFPYEFHCATAAMAPTEHASIYFVCRFPRWIKDTLTIIEVTDVPSRNA